MERKERFALSPFSLASVSSGKFSPTMHLENHKSTSVHKQVRERYLPVIAHKQLSVDLGLAPNLQPSTAHHSETIHSSAPSNPSHWSSKFPSRDKPSDLKVRRKGRFSCSEDNCTKNRQIAARDLSSIQTNSTQRKRLDQSMVGKRSEVHVCHALQHTWKVLRAPNRSNVHITMQYLGRGSKMSTQNNPHQDELKVFQQICGAENICVYKGHLTYREQFQFISRRHFGFPFSATIYVNGMVAARISWCCEHKYRSGFQQGKQGCFRLIGVRGGIPCHRCLMAQQYHMHKKKQTTEVTQPWKKTHLCCEDDRLEKGMMTSSVPAISKSGLFRSNVGERKTAMTKTTSGNTNHNVLNFMDTPASFGEGRRKSIQSCDVGQQNKKVRSGYLLGETLNTSNTSQYLSSDSGCRTHRRNILMRRTHKRAERMDHTGHSHQLINQDSSSNDEHTRRKLYENQRRLWKRGTLLAGEESSDRESGDSSACRKASTVKKKKKRRIKRREARKEIEINSARFTGHVEEGVSKKTWDRGRKWKEVNHLADQDTVSVKQREAVVEENNPSVSSGFLRDLNSKKGGTMTMEDSERPVKDGMQAHNSKTKVESNVMSEILNNKEPGDLKQGNISGGDLSEEHMEAGTKGSHNKYIQKLGKESPKHPKGNNSGIHFGKAKPIDVSKAELFAWVREKLVSALKHAETVRSEPELSDTSEASGSEVRKESEKVEKTPAQGRKQGTKEEAVEFGQYQANEQIKIKGAEHNTATSLAERKANGEAGSSDSVLQTRTKDHSHMKHGLAQNEGYHPETSTYNAANFHANGFCDSFPANRIAVVESEEFPMENVSNRERDEQNPVQLSSETFGNTCSLSKTQVTEDKQTLTDYMPKFHSPAYLNHNSDPARKDQLPIHCNIVPKNGHVVTKLGTHRSEEENMATEQLLDKLVPENDNKTMLTGSMQSQQAVDTLRKQVLDVITVLKACNSVGELIMRNTGLTDDLLKMLINALVNNSQSEVETINLNINNLGPQSAELLVELLKAKPSVKCLLLHGNNLGDDGISILMNGLIDLHVAENTEESRTGSRKGEQPEIQGKRLQLTELDIGSNQLTNKGLKCVASFLSLNTPLKYLGLSQNNAVDLTGWRELFNVLKDCTHISHVLLDENVLQNEGAKYLAQALCVNGSLYKVDLDWNEIGDEGGLALCEALSSNPGRSLRYLSLDGNELSNGVKKELNALLTENNYG